MSEIVDETCKWLREVVAVKQAELTAELTRLRELNAVMLEALKLVDDDVRHHLRSDAIDHCLLRKHAVAAVRAAIASATEQPASNNGEG